MKRYKMQALAIVLLASTICYCMSRYGWRYAGIKELRAAERRISELETKVFNLEMRMAKPGDEIKLPQVLNTGYLLCDDECQKRMGLKPSTESGGK